MIVKNPKWHNREHTMISCDVDWEGEIPHLSGFHPFVAWQDDLYVHGRDLFKQAAAGAFGQITEWGV